MKAASLIVQFVLFFTIGLSFFLLAGNLFRFQSDLIKQEILDRGSALSVNQLSAFAIATVESCKSCDNVTIKITPRTIAGYNPIYQLSGGVVLKIEPENKIVQSTIHNLHHSLTFDTKEVSSSKDITLTYDRTKNKLVIK